MRAGAGLLLPAVAIILAGCSQFAPYATFPRPPGEGVADKGPRVAICYDGLVSSGTEVQQEAQQECAADTRATRVDTDYLLQYCPMLLPARATFVCAPKSRK